MKKMEIDFSDLPYIPVYLVGRLVHEVKKAFGPGWKVEYVTPWQKREAGFKFEPK